jgi:hypothetical protein
MLEALGDKTSLAPKGLLKKAKNLAKNQALVDESIQ